MPVRFPLSRCTLPYCRLEIGGERHEVACGVQGIGEGGRPGRPHWWLGARLGFGIRFVLLAFGYLVKIIKASETDPC